MSLQDLIILSDKCEKLEAENANLKERIFIKTTLVDSLKAENSSLIELAMMVENNSLMPHKHDDYYTRLCCLSERAGEVLKELGDK